MPHSTWWLKLIPRLRKLILRQTWLRHKLFRIWSLVFYFRLLRHILHTADIFLHFHLVLNLLLFLGLSQLSDQWLLCSLLLLFKLDEFSAPFIFFLLELVPKINIEVISNISHFSNLLFGDLIDLSNDLFIDLHLWKLEYNRRWLGYLIRFLDGLIKIHLRSHLE